MHQKVVFEVTADAVAEWFGLQQTDQRYLRGDVGAASLQLLQWFGTSVFNLATESLGMLEFEWLNLYWRTIHARMREENKGSLNLIDGFFPFPKSFLLTGDLVPLEPLQAVHLHLGLAVFWSIREGIIDISIPLVDWHSSESCE